MQLRLDLKGLLSIFWPKIAQNSYFDAVKVRFEGVSEYFSPEIVQNWYFDAIFATKFCITIKMNEMN